MAELAGAELLDPLLQRLEPAGQPAHHRVGAGGDGDEQHDEHQHQAGAARTVPGSGGHGRRLRRPSGLRRARPSDCAQLPGRKVQSVRPSSSLTGYGLDRPVFHPPVNESEAPMRLPFGVVERERKAQPLRPFAQGRGLVLRGRVDAGQRALDQVAPGLEPLVRRRLVALALAVDVLLDDEARGEGEQQPAPPRRWRRCAGRGFSRSRDVSSASCLLANT
jgi:hypothetical protein